MKLSNSKQESSDLKIFEVGKKDSEIKSEHGCKINTQKTKRPLSIFALPPCFQNLLRLTVHFAMIVWPFGSFGVLSFSGSCLL